MKLKKIKTTLDNHHTTIHNATHKSMFSAIEELNEGDFIKIEYNKIPNRKTEVAQIQDAMEKLMSLSLNQIDEGSDIINDTLRNHRGEHKTEYYQRGSDFRNESGYLLLKDVKGSWKSVDIRNTISISKMDGVMLTRNGQ